METLKRTIVWALQPWPLWLMCFIAILHYQIYLFFPETLSSTNKLIALICQLAGGALVLISIDSNLGVLKRSNLLKFFVSYIKKFPPINPPQTGIIEGKIKSTVYASGELTTAKTPTTLEDKLSYLQEQIDELKEKHQKSILSLRQEYEKKLSDISFQIHKTERSINLLRADFENISVGGISLQIFGILLLLYGAITGYFS